MKLGAFLAIAGFGAVAVASIAANHDAPIRAAQEAATTEQSEPLTEVQKERMQREQAAQAARQKKQAELQKIQSAVAAEAKCTPNLSDISGRPSVVPGSDIGVLSSTGDDTGTVYFASCGGWLYSLFIHGPKGSKPEETAEVKLLVRSGGISVEQLADKFEEFGTYAGMTAEEAAHGFDTVVKASTVIGRH
jgi:hypothetical protein